MYYSTFVLPSFGNKLLAEITPDVLRIHCTRIKDQSASASAVRARDIVGQVFTYA